MKKKQKTTEIYYDEGSTAAYIHTHQTSLKNRLVTFARDYPEVCEIMEIDENGKLSAEIQKDRISIRLLPPRTEEQTAKARSNGKVNGFRPKLHP